MGRDMNDDIYGSEVRSLSGIGCNVGNMGSDYALTSLSGEYNKHISTMSGNILNANQNSLSSLAVDYLAYFYHVFPLHPNTFHRLFQHSTQPQLDQLISLITKLYSFNDVVIWSEISLYSDILYLTEMAYVILVLMLYILKSIDLFNALEIYYTAWVKVNLVRFMAYIRVFLMSSSRYLHSLMKNLIKEFCNLINYIFDIIKAKLLYFLIHLELQIDYDKFLLYFDIKSYNYLLEELESEVRKYIETSKLVHHLVSQLLKALTRLLQDNKNLKEIIKPIERTKTTINKLDHKFSYQNLKIYKTLKLLSSINLERSIKPKGDKNELVMNLKMSLGSLEKQSPYIISMNIDIPLIIKFQKGVDSIKKLLDMADTVVSTEIASIIGRLLIVKKINLGKLNLLIGDIQLLYLNILIRGYLLLCTVLFYQEIEQALTSLIRSLEFDCRKVSEFLSKCSGVENCINSVSSAIDKCIEKLAKSLNRCKLLGLRPELLKLYVNMIGRILLMKFYVDLIAMEILIFKMIIMTLVQMSVSSVLIDELIEVIGETKDIDEAIPTLIFVGEYLKAFYFIQLQNTMSIFALSSKLKFSKFIHGYYGVLLLNLQSIQILIWVIECYIHHLIVFKYTSLGLNYQITNVGSLGDIIVQISNVGMSMFKITDKLKLVNKSMEQLKTVSDDASITNWKQSAKKIRQETQSINTNVNEINSQITEINKNRDEIIKSLGKLLEIYNFLLVLIIQVQEVIKKSKAKILGSGIGNQYYAGVILSVLGPCNKQLMFIFLYLVDMWLNLVKLIRFVETTISLIIVKIGWLYGLTSKLKDHVNEIDKAVVAVECAIEGVARNFMQCSLQSLSKNLINLNRDNNNRLIKYIGDEEVDNTVMSMYSVMSVMDYRVVVNRMLEFWTFCDESVKLFRCFLRCQCRLNFESEYRDERPSTFPYSLQSIKTTDINPVSELMRDTMSENVGNHMCLCLVIKYHLRPSLLKCILYLRNEELGTLDTISRKFDNYNSLVGVNDDLWKMCGLILDIIYELTSLLRNRYLIKVKNVCMCSFYDEKHYNYFVSIILVLSSLIENIWSMDTETIRMAIECLSTLYSQLESYELNSFKDTKKPSFNSVYTLLLNKDCKKEFQCKEGGVKCCWWCVTCFNLIIMCIYLCIQCKLCKEICNNTKKACEKVDDYFNLEKLECKCECLEKQDNKMCCLLNLALSGVVGCSEEITKKLSDCCTECNGKEDSCCKKILEKVKAGLCKLLLLGCCCDDGKSGCTTDGGKVEVKCLIFNDLNGCTSMAVVIFCKCKDDKGCCLYTLVEKLESKLKNLCNNQDCCCKDLQSVCKDLCCGKNCGDGCQCSKLKELCAKICNGEKQNCNGAGECLCKLITENISKCCVGSKQCECCKNKGCCRCPCCKILAQSVILLTRACRANVLEPYKRITIELLSCSKDKPELIRRIIKSINGKTLNNIYLVKNSCSSYPYSVGSYIATSNGLTNVETRNWGYDTNYEHNVSTDKGFTNSNNYPDISNNTASYGSGSSNKRFKIIISRLMVGGVIVFAFIRLRNHFVYSI